MLLSGNLWLSMASLVICMHIRFLLNELQKQYNKHLTYHRVVFDMECKYPQVNTKGECLICWDTFRYGVSTTHFSCIFNTICSVRPDNYHADTVFMDLVCDYG